MPDLTTVAAVKRWLSVPTGYADDDVLIAEIIERTEDRINDLCGRKVGPTTQHGFVTGSKVEYFEGDLAGSVLLSFWPVTAVASVVSVTGSDSSGVETSYTIALTRLDVDGYAIGGTFTAPVGRLGFRKTVPGSAMGFEYGEPQYGYQPFIGVGANFGVGRRIKVTYTGGYAVTAIPGQLQQAAIDMAAWQYKTRGQYPVPAGAQGTRQSPSLSTGEYVSPHLAAYMRGGVQ